MPRLHTRLSASQYLLKPIQKDGVGVVAPATTSRPAGGDGRQRLGSLV
jgi:hypothetical protein